MVMMEPGRLSQLGSETLQRTSGFLYRHWSQKHGLYCPPAAHSTTLPIVKVLVAVHLISRNRVLGLIKGRGRWGQKALSVSISKTEATTAMTPLAFSFMALQVEVSL